MRSDPKAALSSEISMETIWTILDAANELDDICTVDACRRAIDARLRGDAPGQSDLAVIAAFFA